MIRRPGCPSSFSDGSRSVQDDLFCRISANRRCDIANPEPADAPQIHLERLVFAGAGTAAGNSQSEI
jgi:hypothetical protein